MDIFVRVINAFLMVALPLALGVFLVNWLKVEWKIFGIGAAVFVASQVFHIPFNIWVLSPGIEKMGLSNSQAGFGLAVIAISYGLSAGIFEEVARFWAYQYWAKDTRNWPAGLMFGAGHGGIEAILLGALAAYGLIQALIYRNTDLASLVPAEQIEIAAAQLEAYWSLPNYLAIMGAVERIGAICIHLSASILVLQVFTRRNRLWLLAAIGWHTLIDAVAVYSVQVWGVLVTEGLVLLLGGLSILIVWLLRDSPEDEDQTELPPQPPQAEDLSPPISKEKLDDSRYLYLMQVISWQRHPTKTFRQ
jgi:uncharacterized membrane protein YhfC